MSGDEKERILELLRSVNDPELGVNIVDLGLVYEVKVNENQGIQIEMTMTSPSCPLGHWIADEAKRKVQKGFPGRSVGVQLVWTPAWTPSKMSPTARKQFGGAS